MARRKQPAGAQPSPEALPAAQPRRLWILAGVLLVAGGIWGVPRLWGLWLERASLADVSGYVASHPDDRTAAIRLAERRLDAGDPAAAEALIVPLVDKDQNDPALWLLRSRAEFDQGKLGPAYASTQVALHLHESAEAHWLMGLLLNRRGDEKGAHGEFDRALALDPDHPGANLELARDDLAHLHYAPALQHVERVLRRKPRDIAALDLRSDAYRNLGNLPRAEADARLAVRLAPNSAPSHASLAQALRDRGLPEAQAEAEREYRRALEINPEAWDLHQQLGQLYFTQGRYPQAITELQEALKANDLNPLPYPALIQCFLRTKQPAEAARLEAKYKKIEEIDLSTGPLEYTVAAMPDDTEARMRLAKLYVKFGRPDMAATQVEEVLKLNPNHPEAKRLQAQLPAKRK